MPFLAAIYPGPTQVCNKDGMLIWRPIIDSIRASIPAHSHSRGIDHIEHHFLTALVRIQAFITDKFLALLACAGGWLAAVIACKDVRIVAGQYANLIFPQMPSLLCSISGLPANLAAKFSPIAFVQKVPYLK